MTDTALRPPTRWGPNIILFGATATMTLILWLLSALLGGGGRATIPGHDIALPIHIVCALLALPLGAFVLWRPKGTGTHKALGRLWAVLMIVVAVTSYWLRTLSGGFSFIHLLSVLTIVSIPLAIHHARRGNIPAHLGAMRGVYIGLVVAGLFAMAPARTLGRLLFG
ncbi:MAG TPA: DUF2306 domain-containing protein [Allosphingosinicella sp.]